LRKKLVWKCKTLLSCWFWGWKIPL